LFKWQISLTCSSFIYLYSMKKSPLWIIGFVSLCLLSCGPSSEQTSLKGYYFPIDSLEDGQVYIYRMGNGYPYEFDVWFYKSVTENGKTFLTAQQYDLMGNVRQFQLQEITATGAMLDQNIFFGVDSTGLALPTNCEILEDSHFPFFVKDTLGIFLSSLSYIDSNDSTKVTLVRNRRFLRDTTFLYMGKSVPAVLMEVKEAYDYDKQGILTVEAKGYETYAQGLGLVSSRKYLQDSIEFSFQLDTTMSMDDFLKISLEE